MFKKHFVFIMLLVLVLITFSCGKGKNYQQSLTESDNDRSNSEILPATTGQNPVSVFRTINYQGKSLTIIDRQLMISFKNPPKRIGSEPLGDPNFTTTNADVASFITSSSVSIISEYPAFKALTVELPSTISIEKAFLTWPTLYPQIATIEPVTTFSSGSSRNISSEYIWDYWEKPLELTIPKYHPSNYNWNLTFDNDRGYYGPNDIESGDDINTFMNVHMNGSGYGTNATNAYRRIYKDNIPLAKDVTIAVIDSGVWRHQRDLQNNLTNYGINVLDYLDPQNKLKARCYYSRHLSEAPWDLPYGPAGDIWGASDTYANNQWSDNLSTQQETFKSSDWANAFSSTYDWMNYYTYELAHGTNCAGIIGADLGNNTGTVGATFNTVKVLPVALSPLYDTTSHIKTPIVYSTAALSQAFYAIGALTGQFAYPLDNLNKPPAIDTSIKVISFSNGSNDIEWDLAKTILNELSQKIVIVCCAGNEGVYGNCWGPARFSDQGTSNGIISVAATDPFGLQSLWPYSPYGKCDNQAGSNYYYSTTTTSKMVDVSAPGTFIPTTDIPAINYNGSLSDVGLTARPLYPDSLNWKYSKYYKYQAFSIWEASNPIGYRNGDWGSFDGTSAATPHVASLAAMLYSVYFGNNPNSTIEPHEIVSIIRNTACIAPTPPTPPTTPASLGWASPMPPIIDFDAALTYSLLNLK